MVEINSKTLVRKCGLSNRAWNILYRNSDLFGVPNSDGPFLNLRLEDLGKVEFRDIRSLRGAGASTLQEIREICHKAGVLFMDEINRKPAVEVGEINKESFIRNCNLSTRTRNVLYMNSTVFGIPYDNSTTSNLRVRDIGKVGIEELKRLRGSGAVTLKEILELCEKTGIINRGT
ncbi:MAG: hypothetical protein WBL21_00110 [Salinimicrobium sp.]